MGADTTTLAELIVQLYKGPWVEALFTNTFLLIRIQQKQGAVGRLAGLFGVAEPSEESPMSRTAGSG